MVGVSLYILFGKHFFAELGFCEIKNTKRVYHVKLSYYKFELIISINLVASVCVHFAMVFSHPYLPIYFMKWMLSSIGKFHLKFLIGKCVDL